MVVDAWVGGWRRLSFPQVTRNLPHVSSSPTHHQDLCCLPRRLVNATLQEELKEIHAFSMKTLTPEQWQEQQQ